MLETRDTSSTRSVLRVVPAVRTREGAGFLVHRAFPNPGLDAVDPFLLLDEMGPETLGPGEAKGAPDHPHRGFETVTYMLAGGMEHRDSQGNSGRIGPGDVQWMTAGAGVIHSEMPLPGIVERGGHMHGFQLWVNLPARDKLTTPHYQELSGDHLPEAESEDGRVRVRVIAGEALGRKAAIDTRTPISYLHFILSPGARFEQPLPPGHQGFAYVFAGEAQVGGDATPVPAHAAAVLGRQGSSVRLEVPPGALHPAEVLLVAGAPLREPVARHGPFVMNTKEQLYEAFRDYQEGRFGRIAPEVDRL